MIRVRIKPGSSQEVEAVSVESWNITDMTKSKMVFMIRFKYPMKISNAEVRKIDFNIKYRQRIFLKSVFSQPSYLNQLLSGGS